MQVEAQRQAACQVKQAFARATCLMPGKLDLTRHLPHDWATTGAPGARGGAPARSSSRVGER